MSTTTNFLRRHVIDTRPLRHDAYRRLFFGLAVSNFGVQFTAIAVPVQMFELTHSSLWVGLLGIAALVPLVTFALWGGVVADRVERRRLLLIASLLMWSATLALLAVTAIGIVTPYWLLGLTAIQAAGFAVSATTRGAIIPRLVDQDELPAANTLSTTSFNLSMALGPLVAALLVKDEHFAAAYAVDAVAFTVVLWATVRLPNLRPRPVEDARALARAEIDEALAADGVTTQVPVGPRSGWREVREGLAYIVKAPVLWLSFAIDIAAMVLAMPRALFPEVAEVRFGAGSVGWLYAAISIGSVIAGLTSGWISRVRRQGFALFLAVVTWGLAVAASGLAASLWLAVLFLAIGGAADLVSSVYRQTILQTYAPDGFQGRMQGVFYAVVAGGPRLGDLRAGATAALTTVTISWVGGGLASAVVAIVLCLAFPALLRYTSPVRKD